MGTSSSSMGPGAGIVFDPPWLDTVIGVFLLSLVVRKIPVATTYAIWTGLGIIGTVLVEYFFFAQPLSVGRIICISLILLGAIGLKLL